MKILILKFRNIGDVLLATPLINNLNHLYPDSTIDFAINKNCADVLIENPAINQVFYYDRDSIKKLSLLNKIRQEWRFIQQFSNKHYDLVINLTEGDRGALIAFFSGAKKRIGILPKSKFLQLFRPYTLFIKKIPFEHTVEKDLFPLSLLNEKPISKEVSIHWSDKEHQKVKNILQQNNIDRFIHIHPVARWFFKCWDDKKFARMIDYIQIELGISVILTASPDLDEVTRVKKIISFCESTPKDLSGQLNLKEVACLSSKAALFFGVDTAPMHIAAAVNTKVIALFGNSLAYIWGPWDNQLMESCYKNQMIQQQNGQHQVIQKDGDDEIIYINGEKLSTAMMRIDVDDVIPLLHRACENISSEQLS